MSESRLTNSQIILMRTLAKCGGAVRAVKIADWMRKSALPLWRRGLVEIWYRQSPGDQPSLQGPYYGLTIFGARLADSFIHQNPAPRGSSGAEEVA